MQKVEYKIAKEFSTAPGPRYIKEGDWSGELFRTEFLSPKLRDAIQKGYILEINLDGTAGYGTSFLEESFGGLIREEHLNYKDINDHITLKSDEEDYLIDDIKNYLLDASKKAQKTNS